MNLTEKIRATARIFNEADRHVNTFRKASGIGCNAGCHMCCLNPDIHATVLEFLPLASHLVATNKHIEVLEKIEAGKDSICVIFNPFTESGGCSMYGQRGLICRLFGFTARTTREGNLQLVTCEPIRKNIAGRTETLPLKMAPQMSTYYMKMYGIDPQLSVRYLHINAAIEQAIQVVAMGTKFRKKRA